LGLGATGRPLKKKKGEDMALFWDARNARSCPKVLQKMLRRKTRNINSGRGGKRGQCDPPGENRTA